MNYFGMYLLAKLDCWQNSAQNFGVILLVIASILTVFTLIVGGLELYSDGGEAVKNLARMFKLKMMFIVSAILLGISMALPTTRQAAFIYVAPQIIENGAVKDTIKNIPELTKLGTDYLKELLKEKIDEQ
jgi:hypothetical protein